MKSIIQRDKKKLGEYDCHKTMKRSKFHATFREFSFSLNTAQAIGNQSCIRWKRIPPERLPGRALLNRCRDTLWAQMFGQKETETKITEQEKKPQFLGQG